MARKTRKPRKRKSTKKRASRRKSRTSLHPWVKRSLWNGMLLMVVGLGVYGIYMDLMIRHEFEGKRWTLPARVYARPLELYPGVPVSARDFNEELALLGYSRSLRQGRPGSYLRQGNTFTVISRPFTFWDGSQGVRRFRASFEGGALRALSDSRSGEPLDLVRMDPYQFASIFPSHHEDRQLVRLNAVPQALVDALLAVEDRDFHEHHGIDFSGLARAAWANLKALDVVQGGSTLTQQLVKNFFLNRERSLTRKAREAAMSLLLEMHYGKNEILEAYLNEVYLGQDGKRAIHGFGLAAPFYFNTELKDLKLSEIALLVGMVKGPSYYDPRRHPERALERRNLVLDQMAGQGVASADQVAAAKRQPLGVESASRSRYRYPAFVDLVRMQLRRDYRDEDLRTEGLKIFTTMDPLVQQQAQRAMEETLSQLDPARKQRDSELQGAVVVTNTGSAEVLALAGDRYADRSGFNRALLAERHVGSLIKPAVYLTALNDAQQYNLMTPLDDSPVNFTQRSGEVWSPSNFDQTNHGTIPLYQGLVNSYNVATVRLGMNVGIGNVVETIHKLGVTRALSPYPSVLLGAVELTPLEVAQMYQTLADGGFLTRLRGIREVLSADGVPLQRYGLKLDQTINPAAVFLTDFVLQEVTRSGTGQSVGQMLGDQFTVAGKTGTSNDLRDSWFAGFSADRLAVVWLGHDDNRSTGLTGATGAMRVWGRLMAGIARQPLDLMAPPQVEWVWADPVANQVSAEGCEGAVLLPFIAGSAPESQTECAVAQQNDPVRGTIRWFKGMFE